VQATFSGCRKSQSLCRSMNASSSGSVRPSMPTCCAATRRESRCLSLAQVIRVGEVAAVAADGARVGGKARSDVP